MSHLPRTPASPPVFDPNDPRYWEPRDLEHELRRTFQICHECRMCVTYCGSFPILFDAVDHDIESGRAEGAEKIGPETISEVTDHCWQCKLCFIKCPYTEDEGARELLDFPRLMAREKAQRARRDGIAIVDRVLGEPQLVGWAGAGRGAPLANFVNAQRLVRKGMELTTGISAEFPLPPLVQEPFSQWLASHDAAKRKMQHNVDLLLPHVRRGATIVVPGPTCGYTMKKEWPVYLGSAEAKEVSAATLDLMEFLDGLRKAKTLNRDFRRGYGVVAYHAPCHLRAQKIAVPGARLLSQLPDTDVRIIERCSAVDGTWGMKAKYYEEGRRYALRMAKAIENEEPDLVITDCSLASLRILKENGRPALHPIQALAVAYGLDDVPGLAGASAPTAEDSP